MYYPLQLDNVGLNRIIRWRDFCSNNVVPFIQEIFNLSIWVILPQWSKCNQRRIKRIEGKNYQHQYSHPYRPCRSHIHF